MKLREVAAMLNGAVEPGARADNDDIRRVAKIEEAETGDITFIANPKYAKHLETTRATAVIVGNDLQVSAGFFPALIRVQDPYASFLKVLQHFNPPKDPLPAGIHPTAVISPSATLGKNVRIGAHVFVGERTVIKEGAMISHNVVLGDDTIVGEATLLHPNVSVYQGCKIGARVIIHSGTTIGSDGFGFAPQPDGTYEKIPQLGIVVIEDDVEIGANCTIDRATLGETLIKKGVKLDNLIQIAHNVVVGENTVSAAQAGISGSTKVGKNCMLGGQVGLTGHLEIADGTKIGAQSGLHQSIVKPNTTVFGSPAFPQREAFRIQGSLKHLPDLLQTVRELQKRVEQLEASQQKKTNE
ncbi:MAG: UDP-3-O-(3-hydroxymyristoyl)glucosamine N-acyltransferase [bacterium]